MPILKCKICGGDMEVSPDKSFGTCEYCGTTMTLPKIDDEQRAAAFNRGNHFRRTGEFDKALQVYERIITEDPNDAEAHWCCALCRYGIEWVEDPATMEYLPTCHRASFDIFTDDIDCKAAIELSDGVTKRQYQKDAVKIADVQKGILLTSQKEEPFDVFICYKETDEAGNRTVDSTLAQDVYYQLTDKGLRVFFARITLEDKAGSQYEPYIFAALHSAKVMVVIGTKPEHFSAVWVKNEWSRFLSLVKKDRNKALLPCYKDMDPYDLPEQLAVLQSYDMSKIGFIQDLIRGIEKIAKAEKPKAAAKEPIAVGGGSVSIAPLLKRAFIFLEDGEWEEADDYCEKVLDQDPENAQAYLGKLMAELEVEKQEDLKDVDVPFDYSNNYQKILRFGDDAIKEKLKSDIAYINERNETARKTGIYNKAVGQMNLADSETAYKEAAEIFQKIPGFKDADELATACLEKAEECRKDAIYSEACREKNKEKYVDAMRHFASIAGWKDADEQCRLCEQTLEKLYRDAVNKMNAAKSEAECKAAWTAFAAIRHYKDTDEWIEQCLAKAEVFRKDDIYDEAMRLKNQASFSNLYAAIADFQKIPGWKDSEKQIELCREEIERIKQADREAAEREKKKQIKIFWISAATVVTIIAFIIVLSTVIIPNYKYNHAISSIQAGNYVDAYEALIDLNGYKDSTEKANGIYEQYKAEKLKVLKVGDTVFFGSYEQDNNRSNGKETIEWVVLAKEGNKVLIISRYALDTQPYNRASTATDVTWETCTLRKWLNATFLGYAFSTSDLIQIQSTTVTADKNPLYDTSPGNNTTDRVFLLSISEANKYFGSDGKCVATDYAIAQGAYTTSSIDICHWWLRSPGCDLDFAAIVMQNGSFENFGRSVNCGYVCVRPALWISLD